jgi:uncharacterized protein
MKSIVDIIATELNISQQQVTATLKLLDEGATVPFIARYRKEATGSLDDTQLRTLAERLIYLRELEDRRNTILQSITQQAKLTPELEKAIQDADTKTRLEDLYLPYKPKRRTKAQIAREAGLAPLADALLNNPLLVPETTAASYLNAEHAILDAKTALLGARQILMEQFAEDAELVGQLREYLWEYGILSAKVIEGKEEVGAKFSDYFTYQETIKTIPSHRALALFRARTEGILTLSLDLPEDTITNGHPCEDKIAQHFGIRYADRPADAWLMQSVSLAWRAKILLSLDIDLFTRLREAAETEAIRVFGSNLRDLLLAAPAGLIPTLGLDPGLRTGVKATVVDATGKLVAHTTIYPHVPHNQWQQAIKVLVDLCTKHQVKLISIGNGTASRETDKLAAELMIKHPELALIKVIVSEAGASVYSASALAAAEFPDIDVSLRGAISIARRLQDPLAELVKIEPKAIGVGQYQHDVNQTQLARALDAVVEDCVNAVGVDVNSASVPLLARISGLNEALARNIVAYRDHNGPFSDRQVLKKVTRFGEKTFEQAAGFLRITNGTNPLDASSVHPEAYPVVERILAQSKQAIRAIMGNSEFLKGLRATDFIDEKFGLPTVTDIIAELEKPGRDPRPEFKTATFKEGVETLADLQPGMILEGTITNVANFGAFVDIGVHQDGLVHISELANQYVKDPRDIVKVGQLVIVKVLDIDLKRQRISLTMRLAKKLDESDKKLEKTSSESKKANAANKNVGAFAGALSAALEKVRN